MLKMELEKLFDEANRQLLMYRRNRDRLQRGVVPSADRAETKRWIAAIEAAHAYYKHRNPELGRAMVRLFGLNHPIPRFLPVRQRLVRLTEKLCVSESTLYRWRREMLELVVFCAIETGALRPFCIEEDEEAPENAAASDDIDDATDDLL